MSTFPKVTTATQDPRAFARILRAALKHDVVHVPLDRAPEGNGPHLLRVVLNGPQERAVWVIAEPAPIAHAEPKPVDRAVLERQVADTERAFAKTMADRDLAAFSSLLSEETVFFSGPEPLRGKTGGDGVVEALL